MKKLKKEIPKFKNETEERKFWSENDSTDFIDWKNAKINPVFSNLKYSTESISLRLPLSLLDDIKIMANKMDVPYQSLIKVILADKVKEKSAEYKARK